ncbi:hypothetical protein JIN77_02850 [Verrucomicrobiaceae bacterium R5-34]|uniref:Uncharacterized protein n=1 Tax=Oceaniferula flava TaxID=2800421 RepID=A0AAE2VBJ3_9BACT|nr:hypothetical protein [Oceaniferula flavus]MBK1829651.1 hypothetical protein [Verrucomicrobiaceae bacterium R5-34]MBK1853841.1 hypothetical protein [Oceaniferula flavus]MBM1135147.1 hypothetical protein [Oceaniferula flavus]
MRVPFILKTSAVLVLGVLPRLATAEPESLTEGDRIALDEQLLKIQQQSQDRVGGLYRRAIQDYRNAIQSDDATMNLYLKCYEKVRYTDEKRKTQDFREWKRRNKDRLNSASMRMALRHQLSWLLLSIEAAQRDGEISEMGQRAMTHLDQIFKNAERLQEHRNVLSQNALSSVFAQAYDLNIKVKDWPTSALDIGGIYKQVIMPPLRSRDRVGLLRSAWIRRIQHEGLVHEKWGKREGTSIGKKDAMLPPEYEKFLAENRPALLWQMEVDCFKVGDEKAAAVNMLNHLQKYLYHKNAPDWIKDFQELINPEKLEGDEVAEK